MLSLDAETKKHLDNLSPEELSSNIGHLYKYNMLWFSVEAMATFNLLYQAKQLVGKQVSAEEFLKQYDISFRDGTDSTLPRDANKIRWFSFPLSKVDGATSAYFPRNAYDFDNIGKTERSISVFCPHYRQATSHKSFNHELEKLFVKQWSMDDFNNKVSIEEGMDFMQGMVVAQRNSYLENMEDMKRYPDHFLSKKLLPKFLNLGDALSNHYVSTIKHLRNE